jgi:DNA-binding NarL/FixJ family response regulator
MLTGNSVIIHPSPVIQLGLKEILVSKGIGISGILPRVPGTEILSGWKDHLVMADSCQAKKLKDIVRSLRRNGNKLIGIVAEPCTRETEGVFDDLLRITDTLDAINSIADNYLAGISSLKSDNRLSSRELEVLTFVAKGLSNRMIAEQLFISIHTVITHRKNITFKLGIKSIPGLTLYAALNNLV